MALERVVDLVVHALEEDAQRLGALVVQKVRAVVLLAGDHGVDQALHVGVGLVEASLVDLGASNV